MLSRDVFCHRLESVSTICDSGCFCAIPSPKCYSLSLRFILLQDGVFVFVQVRHGVGLGKSLEQNSL